MREREVGREGEGGRKRERGRKSERERESTPLAQLQCTIVNLNYTDQHHHGVTFSGNHCGEL